MQAYKKTMKGGGGPGLAKRNQVKWFLGLAHKYTSPNLVDAGLKENNGGGGGNRGWPK